MSTGPGSALLPVVRRLMSFAPSAVPRRQRHLAGRRAVVDGIPFTLPVNSEADARVDGRVPRRR